jgi:hypothetical protein
MKRNAPIDPTLAPFLRLKDLLGRVAQLNAALEAKDYLAARRLLSSIAIVGPALEEAIGAVEALTSVADTVEAAATEQRLTYGSSLEAAIIESGLRYEGSWPEYVIGTVCRVSIDMKREVVTINGERHKLSAPPATAAIIAAFVQDAERGLSVQELREWLLAAFESLAENRSDHVDVRALHEAVASQQKGRRKYTPGRFGIDLYRLMRQEPGLLQCSPAQSASGGIYIPSSDGGNFISAIRLVHHD